MPNCFQLFPKQDNSELGKVKGQPYSLAKIDEELCNLLGRSVDPKFYVIGWFDCIGYLIATNSEMELGSQALRDKLVDWDCGDKMFKVLEYLEANYSSTSFYELKSHPKS